MDEAGFDEGSPPGQVAVLRAYVEVAREHGAIGVAELEGLVAARLGLDPEDPAAGRLLDDADRALMEDPGAPLRMLAPDIVVHVPALTDGIVLTHRLSAVELAEGHLHLDTDLAGFGRYPDPHLAGEPLSVHDADGRSVWCGPLDWFDPLPLDALLAVRVSADGEVTLDVLESEPVATPALVQALRVAYDAEVEQPWLPVSAEDLVLGMLHRDRAAFAEPRPPLTELAAAAFLEQCDHEFAHAESVWKAAAHADLHHRLGHRLGDAEQIHTAIGVLDLLTEQADDPAALRHALDHLEEPDVLVAVTDEYLGDEGPERVAGLVALADRLVAAAGNGPRAAPAAWIAAIAAERAGRVLDAESHLRAASRSGSGWPSLEDRLAWYESDRGDAAAALGRWLAIGVSEDDPDITALHRAAAAVTAPDLARNRPCWCGSGRKYKLCHLGKSTTVPLPERVGWLYRKAITYLERRGGAAESAIVLHAEALAGATDDVESALRDPLVVDVLLHEGGWLERFLADRGPLLPADELALAVSWLRVHRSVFEVVGVRPGKAVSVRDVHTGNRIEVTALTFSRHATVGGLVCARAVPDGVTHQFVGAVFRVPPGEERELRAVLDERDGIALLEWMAPTAAPAL